jgi:predicted Fe-S protein YdhL (DUF1289 family)
VSNNSICRKVCEYDEDGQGSHRSDKEKTCRGCGRTSDEITEWYYATKERKVEIAKAARERTKARKEAKKQRKVISIDLI